MKLYQSESGLLSVIAVIAVIAGATYLFSNNIFSTKTEPVQFSGLTNSDVDQILAIKSEMQAAKRQIHESIALNN